MEYTGSQQRLGSVGDRKTESEDTVLVFTWNTVLDGTLDLRKERNRQTFHYHWRHLYEFLSKGDSLLNAELDEQKAVNSLDLRVE